MKKTKNFVEEKDSRVKAINQNVVDTTSVMADHFVVGNMYRYYNRTFAIWAKGCWDTEQHKEKGRRVVFAVTFDGNLSEEYHLDSDGIKNRIGDERRKPRNSSANDDKAATNTQRKAKTAAETAAQIKAKYSDTVKSVCDKVSKLQADDRILGALNLLCTMIEQTAAERIENITNAARNTYLSNVARRDEIKQTLETNKFRLARAISNDDDEQIMEIGKNNKELKAELYLLEQKIAAYDSAQNAAENVSEQPAE